MSVVYVPSVHDWKRQTTAGFFMPRPMPSHAQFFDEAGVYVITDADMVIAYVGQSTNLANRMSGHRYSGRLSLSDCVHLYRIPAFIDDIQWDWWLLDVERIVMAALRPRDNRVIRPLTTKEDRALCRVVAYAWGFDS